MYNCRYQTLIFKTEQTREELKKLKLKLITHWTQENIEYLIKLYQSCSKNTSRQLASQALRDVEKLVRR